MGKYSSEIIFPYRKVELPTSEHKTPPIPGSDWWQILTGRRNPFSVKEVGSLFDNKGRITLPKSENQLCDKSGDIIEDLKILGLYPRDLLHASFTGVTNHLRIYAIDNEAWVDFMKRIGNSDYPIEELTDDLGIRVNEVAMTGIKPIEYDEKGNVSKVEQIEEKGSVLFIKAQNLQTPLDFLTLCREIEKTDPQLGRGLLLDSFGRIARRGLNAKIWQEALDEVAKNTTIPENLQPILKEAQAMAERYIRWSEELAMYLSQSKDPSTLDQFELIKNIIEEIEKDQTDTIKTITKERLARFMQKVKQRIEKNDPHLYSRLKDLLQKAQEKDIEGLEILKIIEGSLKGEREKRWLLDTLIKRGQKILIDRLPATEAAKKQYENQTGYSPPKDWKFKDYLDWLKTTEPFQKWQKYQKEEIDLNHDPIVKTEEYKKEEQRIMSFIANLTREYRDGLIPHIYPSHPFADENLWNQLLNEINQITDKKIKGHLLKVMKTRRQIALLQADITNQIMDTVGKPDRGFAGGLRAWNPNKGEMLEILETTPTTIISLQEANCTGRIILMQGIMEYLKIFDPSRIRVATTYNHVFLGALDALGVLRRWETSGLRSHSGYGGLGWGVEYSTILRYPVRISWIDGHDGLITNIIINYLDSIERRFARIGEILLLQINPNDESLWWNAGFSEILNNPNNLNWLMLQLRAGEMNDYLTYPHYFLLIQEKEAIKSLLLNATSNDPRLSWIKKSLIVIKSNLKDPNTIQELIRIIRRPQEQYGLGIRMSEDDLKKQMVDGVEELLGILQNISLPPGWDENNYQKWSKDDINDPKKYPLPYLDEKGNILWEYPSKNFTF